ncbi:glycerol-3-phosphate dehydrogenase subunit GlpB [Pectobacterium aroidearum]|uniref:glycerol-3-phosphate dehydrogenase subunit GlpB n=1 Tax=Pectobacterium aroidearum TaxID=1201031 RepID=UPI002113D648|nr:glycerol-3-phosphate dehydrogenase subunit GlpB [Pectobacterium aroidearum]UUE45389.1 glycerol-3-phosphate dehydrogenase subunit GlpB [Pectobacterium aroidearum]UUE49610.1 glycerol-3-phosphate dehydrogenase subunit GlpB [Pectobacterium aroidearum]UUE53814.1 glycerol-3-phosphate dehydrogenase subunit GlpB [Pectobacterium aroidearum]UUE62223.1 glycerol-3-phosphate dehydrogenase subunit GlpB [Pectobacterium aroidearum]UUE66447.1 glycerol-3-phosphate dehydrogenase subunit GlpB [Pectobacterium a
MRYDVVIIGGGLAGLTCGIRLAEQGKRCAIVSAGQNALHFSSGALDLLSHLPDGQPVSQPLEALDELARQAPHHPYSRMGAAAVAALLPQVEALLERSTISLLGSYQQNHWRMTPLGKFRVCWLSPVDGVTRGLPDSGFGDNPLIAGIEGFLDFQSRIVAGTLQAQGIAARSDDLKLPVLDRLRQNPSEFRAVNIARVLDRPENRAALVEELSLLANGNDAIIMPACLGLDSPEVVGELAEALGKPISLLPTLPPSVLGLRLHQALSQRFRQLGGMVMPGDRAVRAVLAAQEIAVHSHHHRDIPLRAKYAVLASGSFFSNGLVTQFDRVTEPVFGLDVRFAEQREGWSQQDVFAPQPYMQFGAIVDEHLHPRIGGETIGNLYAIGAVLEGFDPIAQGCGAGVSLLSALHVAEQILKEGNP